MSSMLILGLAAAVLLATITNSAVAERPQPPQIIYVQSAAPAEPSGSGCLPLLIVLGVILAAIAFG